MKKRIPIAVVLTMVLALVAGCSGGGGGSSPSPAPEASGPAGEAAEAPPLDGTRPVKDEIIFAQGQDIYSLVPWFTRLQRTTGLTNNIFEGLVFFDTNMEVEFLLGTSYEWKDDVTLVFQLRDDVVFHNGEKMTAEDVAYSLNTLANEPYMVSNAGWIQDVEVTGEWEVTINLGEPYGAAIGALCHPAMVVAPKAYMEDPDMAYETMPVGTGPYRMKDYKIGEYYTLERHEDYWNGAVPTRYLTLKIIPEPAQRTILLETGDIDVAYEIPMNDYNRVEGNDDLKLWVNDSMKIYMLYPNCESSGAVGNKLVRQAIMHGIDTSALIESMLYGYGNVATSLVVSSVNGYIDCSGSLRYDPELAKQLLAEAGYADGCDVTVWTSSEQNRVEMCQIFQAQLQEIGVNLEIEVMDQSTSESLMQAGEDFGFFLHFQNNMPKHIDQTLWTCFVSDVSNNYSRYSNPELDRLANEIRSVAEADGDRLMELSGQAMEILFDDVPAIPTYNEAIIIATSGKLEGLKISQVGAHQYKNAYIYAD